MGLVKSSGMKWPFLILFRFLSRSLSPLYFWDRVSLYRPGWLRIYREAPASAFVGIRGARHNAQFFYSFLLPLHNLHFFSQTKRPHFSGFRLILVPSIRHNLPEIGHPLPQLQLPSQMILKSWSPASVCPRGGGNVLDFAVGRPTLGFSSGPSLPEGFVLDFSLPPCGQPVAKG